MSEMFTITFAAGNDVAIESAANFLERFLAESVHCRSAMVSRDLLAPERTLLLNWEWDSPQWRALAWQQVIDVLADAGAEFTIDQANEPIVTVR